MMYGFKYYKRRDKRMSDMFDYRIEVTIIQ